MTDIIFDNIKIQFEQFLSLISNTLVNEEQINILQNKLRRRFNTTLSSYLWSTDFRSLLNNLHCVFKKNDKSTKYFTLLSSFDEELKKHRIKSTGSHQSSSKTSSSIHSTESVKTTLSTNEKTVIISSKSSNTIALSLSSSTINRHKTSIITSEELLDSCNNIFSLLNESHLPLTTTDSVNTNECEIEQEKKITKLERRLNSLSKTIRQLEEQDMSLDEMEHCDLYKVESHLKKQAYDIYTKLAQLKSQSSSIHRILDQPVILTDIDNNHPLINQALEDMVNQTKYLPAFHDVLNTVEKTNERYKLNLSIDTQKILAEKSFKLIGTKVKNRRMADFNDIMNSRLPEDFDIERNDPALNSTEIENTLIKNEREAVIKTEKIFEEFSRIDPELESEDNIESSDESIIESDEESDDEEETQKQVESKIETFNQPLNDTIDETQFDIVDILPPFSSKSSSPVSSVPNETIINNEDSLEAIVEISLNNNRTLTLSSTLAIPSKTITCDSTISIIKKPEPDLYTILDSDDTHKSQCITIIEEHEVQTIIPRRRHNAIQYNFYKQQLTNNSSSIVQKRLASKQMESTDSKKLKEQPEIVTLD